MSSGLMGLCRCSRAQLSARGGTQIRLLCSNTPASSGSSSSTALAEEVLKNEKGEVSAT